MKLVNKLSLLARTLTGQPAKKSQASSATGSDTLSAVPEALAEEPAALAKKEAPATAQETTSEEKGLEQGRVADMLRREIGSVDAPAHQQEKQ